MDDRFFDETGETIKNDFPSEYHQNIIQLAHDLKQSQGGFDEQSLAVIMEIDANNPPARSTSNE